MDKLQESRGCGIEKEYKAAVCLSRPCRRRLLLLLLLLLLGGLLIVCPVVSCFAGLLFLCLGFASLVGSCLLQLL